MYDSPAYLAYEAKLLEATHEIGADMIPGIGFLATSIYANDFERGRVPLPAIAPEKREQVFAFANALAEMLRAAEPPSMREL
jgi:hypothetical protein